MALRMSIRGMAVAARAAVGLALACSVDERNPQVVVAPDVVAPDVVPIGSPSRSNAAPQDAMALAAGSLGDSPNNAAPSPSSKSSASSPDNPPSSSSAMPSTPAEAVLQITLSGDGPGGVKLAASNLPAQECLEDCTLSVPLGTDLSLTASPGLNTRIRSWSVPECGSETTCRIRVDTDLQVQLSMELAFNVAFATSRVYSAPAVPRPGNLASQECQALAAAAGVHGTRFIAWLSAQGPSADEADDVAPANLFQHTGGWVRADGQPVARSRAALLRGEILHPIGFDEQGDGAFPYAWSSTSASGLLARNPVEPFVYSCNDWATNDMTLLGGIVLTDSVSLGDSNVTSCSGMATLLCFGDDSDDTVPVPLVTGRLAFLSKGSFTANGGVSGADALCQSEACEAGLTGSTNCGANSGASRRFKAYLHTSTQPAWERFDLNGPPWVRADGVVWLPDAADLASDGGGILTALNVHVDSTYGPPQNAWVGSVDGTLNCRDWTSASSADQGLYGTTDSINGSGIANGSSQTCEAAEFRNFLFCLED